MMGEGRGQQDGLYQWLKTHAAKLDDLNTFLGHGENREHDFCKLSFNLHSYALA